MKYPSRLCKGCHEPTDTYRTGCRTCQARHRAIRLHKNPRISSGQPICPRCWRTAGISLPACSIQPENYGQRIAIENQWNPIYSICRACIHAPEGTVPLDSPRSIFLSTLELDELQSSEFTLREQIRFFFLRFLIARVARNQ